MIPASPVVRLVATSILLALAACGSGGSVEQRVADAERRIDAGEYSAAIIELKNLLEKHPDDAAALLALARASLFTNNLEGAAKSLEDAQAHGADAARLADLRVRLMRQSGAHDVLLKQLDSPALALDAAARGVARAQALAARRNCAEAIRAVRPLLGEARVQVSARVVLAECYAQSGLRKQARDLLESTTSQWPQDAEAWTALGRLQFLLGDGAAAEKSWIEAGKHAPGQLTVLQQLGIETSMLDVQLGRGDLEAAEATLGRAVKIASQAGLTALIDARLRLAKGDFAGGEPLVAALVGRAPDFDAARIVWASALLTVGKREQALSEASQLARRHADAANLAAATEVLRELVNLAPDTEVFWLSSARAHLLLGQPALARLALDSAEVVAPQSSAVAMDRIKLEITGGNAAEGLRRAEILVARRPDDDAATLLLAQARRDNGDLAASLESLKRVQARNPSGETAALIFNVSRELGTDEGFGVLERWTANHRDARALQAMLAEGYLGAGRNREAIAAFEKMIAADPKSVFALNNLAWVYYLEKDARAVPTARRAFELAPRAPQIADTYGWLLLERGDHAEALRILQETDAAAPLLDPESRYHLAAALARNGKREEAAHQLSRLLEEAGSFPARPAAQALAASLK